MSSKLRSYLIESYKQKEDHLPKKARKDYSIQIDDQDNNDNINEFCNIFVKVHNKNRFSIQLTGNFPLSRPIIDLAEICKGFADPYSKKVLLNLSTSRVDALADLAARIRETAYLGDTINNPRWFQISARTISTLYRFVRIIKEYTATVKPGMFSFLSRP